VNVRGAFATAAGGLPELHWEASHDGDLDHYDVYASDQPAGSLSGMHLLRSTTALSCVDSSYVPGTNRYYRVAAVGTRFSMPQVNLGINPVAGGTQRLPRLVGPATALQMINRRQDQILGDHATADDYRIQGLFAFHGSEIVVQ